MPGISVSKIPIPFRKAGISWSSYWATLISATVETAAPTHVVLTFPTAQPSLGATDFIIAGFTISSASWTDAVLTLVLSSPVLVFDGNIHLTFVKTGAMTTVTNNVADDGETVRYYNFRDVSTFTKTSANLINAWADALGAGDDLAAPAGNEPNYKNTGVEFPAAAGKYLKTPAIAAIAQPTYLYAVIKQPTWASSTYIFDGITTGKLAVIQRNSTPELKSFCSGDPYVKFLVNNGLALDTWGILRVFYNGATSKIQVNSAAVVNGDMGAGDGGGFTIGTRGTPGAGTFSNVIVKDIILRKNIASETDIYNSLWRKYLIPDGVGTTIVSQTSLKVTWDLSSLSYDGHKIYMSTDGSVYTLVNTVAGATAELEITGLNEGTKYYFYVTSYKGAAESAPSAIATATINSFDIAASGDGTGVNVLRMTANSDQTLVLTGAARFYSDAAGTLNESTSWQITTGADYRTRYVKCTSGTGKLIFNSDEIIGWGYDHNYGGWLATANAPTISIDLSKLSNLKKLSVQGNATLTGTLPTGLTVLDLEQITWDCNNETLPVGLTYVLIEGLNITGDCYGMPAGCITFYIGDANISWHYTGALPAAMTFLRLKGPASQYWTYTGALPVNMVYLCLIANDTNWTYNGALPNSIYYLNLAGDGIVWTYNGALPTALTSLSLDGADIDWTGLDISGTGDFAAGNHLLLTNYRQAKMSSADMITLLTSMTNRVGDLPNVITINDYADYASPPSGVTDAVAALKVAKANITTVNLGA